MKVYTAETHSHRVHGLTRNVTRTGIQKSIWNRKSPKLLLHNHKNAQALKMNNTKAFEAAKAVNRILEFSGEECTAH